MPRERLVVGGTIRGLTTHNNQQSTAFLSARTLAPRGGVWNDTERKWRTDYHIGMSLYYFIHNRQHPSVPATGDGRTHRALVRVVRSSSIDLGGYMDDSGQSQ